MKVLTVAAGYGGWDKYTQPLIDSIRRHEPGAELVVVDNGSPEPYPQALDVMIRLDKNEPYARAMNLGVAAGLPDWDWLVALNNDVLCSAPYVERVGRLRPGAIYGPELGRIGHYDFLLGWCLAIPRALWDEIGGFDEGYPRATYEDIDYSYRAALAGYRVEQVFELPFVHLDAGTRRDGQINDLHIWAGALFERKHAIPLPLRRYSPRGLVDTRWL